MGKAWLWTDGAGGAEPALWLLPSGLIFALLALPFLLLIRRAVAAPSRPHAPKPVSGPVSGPVPGILPKALALRALEGALQDDAAPDPACLILLSDGARALDPGRLAGAVLPALRLTDVLCRVDGGLAVILSPAHRLDLESMIPIAVRLQCAAAAAGPVSVGFCLADLAPSRTGAALLHAARLAAEDARRNGPSAIRSFRADLLARVPSSLPRALLAVALDKGEFIPHFQPQTCARTGLLTGAEVLARWHHPARGSLTPAAFLDDIRDAGLSSRLTAAMLAQALAQLRVWDGQGLAVPALSINLDAADLADPVLPDRIAWELDRHSLPPHRLTVEVLETVLADGAAVTVRNIDRLARMGCGVDLDDFGTGQAAIGQLRRLTIRRIKIDRSFVRGIEHDPDQRRMVAAILSMADRLGLDTVAEGVETPAAAAALGRLGCGHLQGWAVAHPMPGADLADWLTRHDAAALSAPVPPARPQPGDGPTVLRGAKPFLAYSADATAPPADSRTGGQTAGPVKAP